jgi:hypothetical protein
MRERPVYPMGGNCRTAGRYRQISSRMARYLEGKIPVDANELSLKEATE